MTSVIIRLQNLSDSAQTSDIRQFFSGLKIPDGGVHIVGGENGDAFIAFSTDEDARKAMLLDSKFIKDEKIRLFLSSKAEMQSVIEKARLSVQIASMKGASGQYSAASHSVSGPPVKYDVPAENSRSGPPEGSYSQPHGFSAKRPNPSEYGYGYGYTESWDSGYKKSNEEPDLYGAYRSNGAGPNGGIGASSRRDFAQGRDEKKYYGEDAYNGYHGNPYDSSRPSGPPHQSLQEPRARNVPAERDFFVRPSWLNDGEGNGRPPYAYDKRSAPSDTGNGLPYKRHRVDESIMEAPPLDFIVKITMRPSDISIRNLFDMLRGVDIIPKYGIRIEQDALNRFTGNLYCLLANYESHYRALSYDGSLFHGSHIKVVDSTAEEYLKVTDISFRGKCPPSLLAKLPPPESVKPMYYADGCIEMSEVPPDVTEADIVSFLGVPGLTTSDVKIVSRGVVLVRLPSARDLDILLGAPPRPFGPNQTENVRLIAISAMQFNTAVVRPLAPPKPPPGPAVRKTCCFIYGFTRDMTIYEITQIFPDVFIAGDNIHLLPNQRSAVIDFATEDLCKQALRAFVAIESDLKLQHRNIAMRSITRAEYDQKLQENSESTPSPRHSQPPPPPSGSSARGPRMPPPPYLRGGPGAPPRRPPSSSSVDPPPHHRSAPSPVTVFVSNLPLDCPPQFLLNALRPYRPLPNSLQMRRDPRSRSTTSEAMILFGSRADAEAAVAEHHNRLRCGGNVVSMRVKQQ